jgi:Protein of unknown function (DUF3800)
MKVYFDESGDFNPSTPGRPKFCFVLGVIIPEAAEDALQRDFAWFLKQLGRAECKRGEPKGSLLSLSTRRVLLEILKAHKDVMLVPISVNLAYEDPQFFSTAPGKIRALIEGNLHLESAYMAVEARAELARRIGRLSVPVLVRLVASGIAALKAIEAIVCRYHCDLFHSSYDPIEMIFDRVVTAGAREELVFRDVLFGWIANWSRTTPIRIPTSLGESHPLLRLYANKQSDRWVLDLGKMLAGKIRFEDSKYSWQIQLADFMANTWSQTLGDHGLQRGFHALFRDLFRKSALPKETPLGVVAPTDRTEVVPAPSYLEVFARMAIGESKILPCE